MVRIFMDAGARELSHPRDKAKRHVERRMGSADEIKVAYFSTTYLQHSQAFVYRELQSLKHCDVHVFCRREENLERFPFANVHCAQQGRGLGKIFRGLLYEYLRYSSHFVRKFHDNAYDVVHAQFGPGGIYAMYYAKKFDLPLIVTFCGYDVPLLQTKRRFSPAYWRYWLMSGELFRRCSSLLAVSQDLAARLIALGAPEKAVRVFHRGIVIPEKVQPPERVAGAPMRVVMAGRFVEKKGFEYGVRAVHIARSRGAKLEMQIIGKGEGRANCAALIEELALGGIVEILDDMPQEQLFALLQRSHVIMVPSVTARNGDVEGIPNILKEGAARGLAAVVTAHGGNGEVVCHEKSGFIVPERDSEALAECLVTLEGDPALMARMGLEGAAWVREHFDIERTGEQLAAIYRQAVTAYRRGE